ncbi:MAG: cyclic nucleotide-binding domain-containing protein [Gammaproteobacteria bacterium]|nr:cyclic nucleotide-binding domain-containing protein [Gammaproteobacteria bacterium]
MDLQTETNLLARVPMFAKLSPSKLKLLAFTSELVSLEPGERLFDRGDDADSAYVIVEGHADILGHTEEGDMVVGTLGVNELVGEMGVLTNARRSATIVARDHMRALRIQKDVFVKLLMDNAEVALDVVRQLSDKLARTHRLYEAAESELQKLRAG